MKEYVVERILKKKFYRDKIYYLIKWEGYQQPTWEPDSNCEHCSDLIAEFNSSSSNTHNVHQKKKVPDTSSAEENMEIHNELEAGSDLLSSVTDDVVTLSSDESSNSSNHSDTQQPYSPLSPPASPSVTTQEHQRSISTSTPDSLSEGLRHPVGPQNCIKCSFNSSAPGSSEQSSTKSVDQLPNDDDDILILYENLKPVNERVKTAYGGKFPLKVCGLTRDGNDSFYLILFRKPGPKHLSLTYGVFVPPEKAKELWPELLIEYFQSKIKFHDQLDIRETSDEEDYSYRSYSEDDGNESDDEDISYRSYSEDDANESDDEDDANESDDEDENTGEID